MQALPVAGAGLVILFLLLVLVKKNKKRSDLFLALFFLLIGAELIYRYLIISGSEPHQTALVGLDLIYWILFGPAIFLYALFTIRKDLKFSASMLLHLIPLAIILIPYIHFLALSPGTVFFNFTNHHPVYRWIIDILWEFAVSVYLILTMALIRSHRRKLNQYFSSFRNKELNWLFYLSGGFLAYVFITLSIIYLSYFGFIPQIPLPEILSVTVLIIFLLGIGVFGYRQQGIFSGQILENISNLPFHGTLPVLPEREFKYRKSGLQNTESEQIMRSLKQIMKAGKPWLDPELTLQDLSARLNTTIHKLSQVINEQSERNFYDYINSYRIDEVKKRLQDSRYNHLKVIAIAYDCGFNSKSAFYTAFRKASAMTPVEYRRKYQPEHGTVFSN